MEKAEDSEYILVVRAISCKLTRDTELFGKMDPYCLLQLNNQKVMTKVKIDAGKQCEWNETFVFKAKNHDILKYQVWDEDPGADDLVGEGKLTINPSYIQQQSFWLILFYNNNTAGELNLEIQIFPLDKEKIEKTKTLQILINEKSIKLDKIKRDANFDTEIINSQEVKEREKSLLAVINEDKIKISELENKLLEMKKILKEKLEDEEMVLTQQTKKLNKLTNENEGLTSKLDLYKKNIGTGTLLIYCEKAFISRDTELIGEMDPFTVFYLGNKSIQTKTLNNAGKNPLWKEQLKIERDDEEILYYTLYDYNKIRETRLIGYGAVSIYTLMRKGGQAKKDLPIMYSGKKIGSLDIELKFCLN